MDWSKLLTGANLGWGTVAAGVIAIIVAILNYFSPDRVKQRYRLERDKLEKEKEQIEASQPTPEIAERLLEIEKRLKIISDYFASQ